MPAESDELPQHLERYNYSYDSMCRLSAMTQSSTSNVSYNAAHRLLTINYPAANETRSYNVLNPQAASRT